MKNTTSKWGPVLDYLVGEGPQETFRRYLKDGIFTSNDDGSQYRVTTEDGILVGDISFNHGDPIAASDIAYFVKDATARHDSLDSAEKIRQRDTDLRASGVTIRKKDTEISKYKSEIEDLETRVKVWSSATAGVAGTAAALLLAGMIFGIPRPYHQGSGISQSNYDNVIEERNTAQAQVKKLTADLDKATTDLSLRVLNLDDRVQSIEYSSELEDTGRFSGETDTSNATVVYTKPHCTVLTELSNGTLTLTEDSAYQAFTLWVADANQYTDDGALSSQIPEKHYFRRLGDRKEPNANALVAEMASGCSGDDFVLKGNLSNDLAAIYDDGGVVSQWVGLPSEYVKQAQQEFNTKYQGEK